MPGVDNASTQLAELRWTGAKLSNNSVLLVSKMVSSGSHHELTPDITFAKNDLARVVIGTPSAPGDTLICYT